MRLIDYYNIAAAGLMILIVCAGALLSARRTRRTPEASKSSENAGRDEKALGERCAAEDRGARVPGGSWLQGRGYWVVVLAVLTIGAFLRLWNLEGLPYGMQQDEASIGYEAYSLATYGIDRNGYSWPVYPITWGSGGGSPIMIYLNVITVWLFGSSVWSVRIVPAFLGTLTLVLFFAVLYRGFGRRTALAGLLLLSITPWHVILSRWSLDSNTTPFWQILAAAVFLLAVTGRSRRPCGEGSTKYSNAGPTGHDMHQNNQEKGQYTAPHGRFRRLAHADPEAGSAGAAAAGKPVSCREEDRGSSTGLLCLAAFLYGVCMYSYGSANVVVPLTLLFLSLWGLKYRVFTVRQLVGCGITFVVTCLPLLIFYAVNFLGLPEIAADWISFPRFTSSHFSSVFVSFDASLPAALWSNLKELVRTLTIGDPDEVAWNTMPEYWTLYKFTWPIVFAGMAWTIRKCWRDWRRGCVDALSAVNTVMTAQLAAALIFNLLIQASVNREVMLFLPLVYCLVMGLRWIYRSGRKYAAGPAAAGAQKILSGGAQQGGASDCGRKKPSSLCGAAVGGATPEPPEAARAVTRDRTIRTRRKKEEAIGRWSAYAALLLILAGAVSFCRDYYGGEYNVYAAEVFMPGYGEAMIYADEAAQEDGATVYSTYNLVASPYMLTLFYTQYDTYDFLDTVEYRDEEAEFRVATSFGHFVFGLPVEDTSDLSALMGEEYWRDVFVLTRVEAEQFDEMLYDITWFGDRFAVVVRRQE